LRRLATAAHFLSCFSSGDTFAEAVYNPHMEDAMNDFGMGDLFKKSLEFQQNMFKNWMSSTAGAFPGFGANAQNETPFDGAPFTQFTAMNKMFESLYGNWQNQFVDNPWMKMQPWTYNMFSSSNPMFDIFNKMMNSGKSLTDLSAIWQQLMGKDPLTSREEILKFLENNRAAYEKLAQDFMNPFVPEAMRPMLSSIMDIMKQYEATGKDLSKPWTEFAEKNAEAAKRLMQGDATAYNDFYKTLSNAYEESYGKIFKATGMGLTREQNEKIMGQFDTFFKMFISMSELMTLISNVSKENMVSVIETYGKLIKEGKQPQSFKEFYDLWVKVNEDAFVKVFGTPQFSKIFCEFAQKACEYKIYSDKVLEQLLDWAPFPKNSEMVSLYKTVYELRKSGYQNTKQIEAMQEELTALKAAVDGLLKNAKKGDK